MQFGLNLPAGIITQGIVSITIYDEADNIVWANSGLFSNGEHRWEWDGRNGQSGEPDPNGLYCRGNNQNGSSVANCSLIPVC